MPKAKKAKATQKDLTDAERRLVQEVSELTKEVKKLKNLEFIKVFKKPGKFIWFSFLKGLAVGFGSVLGASIVVGIFVFLLSQLSEVPVVGDFSRDLLQEIQGTNNP